jgi:hypothetical protein
MVFADLIGRRRNDYRIRRGPFVGIDKQHPSYMIAVPFVRRSGCAGKMIEMRAKSMEFRQWRAYRAVPVRCCCIVQNDVGPAIEEEWNVFYR